MAFEIGLDELEDFISSGRFKIHRTIVHNTLNASFLVLVLDFGNVC